MLNVGKRASLSRPSVVPENSVRLQNQQVTVRLRDYRHMGEFRLGGFLIFAEALLLCGPKDLFRTADDLGRMHQ